MVAPREFAQKQLELIAEFGKFVFEHPEVDADLPEGACICFDVADEPEFNLYSRELAERQHRQEGCRMVLVRVQGLAPPRGSLVELEGAPDLVVEIISDSSVTKDTRWLPQAYFAAGVSEFWLVDARREPLLFRIHRPGLAAFEPVPLDAGGFQHSAVLGCRCRLDRRRNTRNHWVYDLLTSP